MQKNIPEIQALEAVAGLRNKSIRGGLINLIAQGLKVLTQLVSTVVLARLLSPEDYGIIGMVLAFTAIAGLLNGGGLSTVVIQRIDLNQHQLSNLYWLSIAIGIVTTLFAAGASPLVAWFFEEPKVCSAAAAMSLTFLFTSLGGHHMADLSKKMQFGRVAVATVGGAIINLGVALVAALFDQGYWSLVYGNLAGSAAQSLLLIWLSDFKPHRPQTGAGLRDCLDFGAFITGFEFLNYFHRNLDNILIGKFWGPGSLGNYSRAYQLLMLPVHAIRGPLNRVALPAMSRLQHDKLRFRRYYRRVTAVLAMISMPMAGFCVIRADELVEALLGPNWSNVGPIFAALGLTSLIQPVASLRGLVLMSRGEGRKYFIWGLVNAVLVSIGFCIGVLWGPIGIAYAYAVTNYLILVPSLLYCFRGSPLTLGDFFCSIQAPFFATVVGCLTSIIVGTAVMEERLWMFLTTALISFSIAYLIALLIHPSGRSEIKFYHSLANEIGKRTVIKGSN